MPIRHVGPRAKRRVRGGPTRRTAAPHEPRIRTGPSPGAAAAQSSRTRCASRRRLDDPGPRGPRNAACFSAGMRRRPFFVAVCAAGVVGSALACTSNAPSSGPAPYDTAPTVTAPAPTATAPGDASKPAPTGCDLAASGVKFASAACGSCMQASCCTVTKTCFVDAPECAALYTCINACPSRGLGPTSGLDGGGEGGSGGGGGGDGGADAGDPCVDTCNSHHPTQVNAARDYIRCYAGNCRTQCQ